MKRRFWIHLSAPKFTINDQLRDVPEERTAVVNFVKKLEGQLEDLPPEDFEEKARLLGEIGTYQRTLGNLEEAQRNLLAGLDIIKTHGLNIKKELQFKIRLAHVYQYLGEFQSSNSLFEEILTSCDQRGDVLNFKAFALQHSGKNQFDQNNFQTALDLFQQALEIRIQLKVPQDQISSSMVAIKRVQDILQSGK